MQAAVIWSNTTGCTTGGSAFPVVEHRARLAAREDVSIEGRPGQIPVRGLIHPHMHGRAYPTQTQSLCLHSRMGRERCFYASEQLRRRPRPGTSLWRPNRIHPTQRLGGRGRGGLCRVGTSRVGTNWRASGVWCQASHFSFL